MRAQRHPLVRFLADLRLAAVLLAVFAIASALGTWIEAHYANLGSIATGQNAAYDLVYDAPWFNALLGLLFLNLSTNLLVQVASRRKPAGSLLVHVGMLLILAGAGLTRGFGYEGVLSIREGQANRMVASNDNYVVATRGDGEAAMAVRLYAPGPQTHERDVELDGQRLTLGVSEFWPRFEPRLVPGARGTARVVVSGIDPYGKFEATLRPGEEAQMGAVTLRFRAPGLPTPETAAAPSIDFALADGEVVLRASAIERLEPDGRTATVSPELPLRVQSGLRLRGPAGLHLLIEQVAASLVMGGVASSDPKAPAAARLFIAKDGETADAICVQGADAQVVELGGAKYALRYGPIFTELPYSLYLEDFVLQTYPGSDNPASYESHVVLTDDERGIEGRAARIWMNHPLNHRGTKHFQSSYDPDLRGTVLSVNRDPGKQLTYLGYAVISTGFLLAILRIFRRRMRALRAVATAATVLAPTVVGGAAHAKPPRAIESEVGGAGGTSTELSLSAANLHAASRLIVQDFRGRMKPLDTLARETALKITKREHFESREPVELFLSLATHPKAWFGRPALFVKNAGVQAHLGVATGVRHVPLSSVLLDDGYRLRDVVGEAHRTPSNRRTKTEQQLILFDERVHLFFGALQGNSLRIFPIPDDPANTWHTIEKVLARLSPEDPRRLQFELAAGQLFEGLMTRDQQRIGEGLQLVHELQQRYGAAVVPSELRLDAELTLNQTRPFALSIVPYLAGFLLMMTAFFVGLLRHGGTTWSGRRPLYLLGMLAFAAGFAVHAWGFALRWVASGRAPLSNSHETLLWVALAVGLAGLLFELASRTGAVGALASLLTGVVLGVATLGTFDPSIGPLMPVLASHWLIIHVTVITASYGFLGLSCLLGLLTMTLLTVSWRRPNPTLARAIRTLDPLNVDVMVFGLGLLVVGTLLGGVWANESWGRYWGWDPKETWALVSILLYSVILHLRWVPALNNPFVQATGSFLAIWSIIMTYFGVNYLLMGMHSYAAGDKVAIPSWAIAFFILSILLCVIAHRAWSDQKNSWRKRPALERSPSTVGARCP